jgi:hypothetical protein
MGRNFERRDGVVRATFAPVEVELLRGLRDELERALREPEPEDPVFRRLFPTAVLGDQQADRDLRAIVRDDLLGVRLQGLRDLVEVLDRAEPHRGGLRVDLVDEEPLLVLGVLNDLRLAIGARVDIESLERDGPLEEDVAYRLEIMDHLAWLQEQLLAIVDPPSVSHYEEHDLDPDDL